MNQNESILLTFSSFALLCCYGISGLLLEQKNHIDFRLIYSYYLNFIWLFFLRVVAGCIPTICWKTMSSLFFIWGIPDLQPLLLFVQHKYHFLFIIIFKPSSIFFPQLKNVQWLIQVLYVAVVSVSDSSQRG